MRNFWMHFVLLLAEQVVVVALASVDDLMLGGSLFSTKSKSDCQDSVGVIWIGSPEVSITFVWTISAQGHVSGLRRAGYLIWWVFTFFADLVICCFHQFVHTKVQIDVALVYTSSFAVENLILRFVVDSVWGSFYRCQMCF